MCNKKKWIGIAAILLVATGCNKAVDDVTVKDDDAMVFKAKVDGIVTKASYSQYADQTTLLVGVLSNVKAIDDAMAGSRTTTLKTKGSGADQLLIPSPILYWNDMGGRDADVNVWGVNTAGQSVTVSERGVLSWAVAANQSSGVLAYDLHWSDNVKNLHYKETAALEFRHAMSKITINLTVGEGFTAAEAAVTTITLPNNFTTTDVDASKSELSNVGGKTVITPSVSSAFNGGMKASYEAIVVPTREIAINDTIAIIKLGANTYYVHAKESRTLESGKNYIYNVSVKKSGVTFVSSVIVDWENVEGSADSEIIFTAGAGTGGENGTGDNALDKTTEHFDIYTSHDNSDYDADSATDGTQPATSATWVPASGTPGSEGYVAGHWENDVPIYWNDDNDDTYFRGFSTGDGTTADSDEDGNLLLEAGENDYVWGTSGNDAIEPNTGNVSLDFKHIMSKVVITVVTTDDADSVSLATISEQFINNIAINGKFNVANGTFASFTDEDYGSYTLSLEEIEGSKGKKYTYEFYVFPQELKDSAMVNITVGTAPQHNTYHKQLNQIAANGSYISKWEAGKRYVYTIRIKKEEQKFTAMLTDWEDVIAEDADAEL